MAKDKISNTLFILLKNLQSEILAQGELIEINGVVFNNEEFNIMGIGGIIANIKGQRYGRKLMETIKRYLSDQNKTGVGFTRIPIFYQKCGFSTDKESLRRFVHITSNGKITNTSDEYVLYIDSTDRFMKKVLSNPEKDVHLPRDPDW